MNLKKLLTCLVVAFPFVANAESSRTVFGLTSTGDLIRFQSDDPTTVTTIDVESSEPIIAIDFRPADNVLYALTRLSTNLRVNTVDLTTGALTSVAVVSGLAGTSFSMDFNPTVDRIRVVNDEDDSFRINPDTGALAATDTDVAYVSGDDNDGDDPSILGVAYTNNFSTATLTTLVGIDSLNGILVRIGGPNGTPSPNTGELNSLGSLGVTAPLTNVGLDIASGKSPGTVLPLLVATASGETSSKLYSVDIVGGKATLIGSFPSDLVVSDIAISGADIVDPDVLVQAPTNKKVKGVVNNGLAVEVTCSEACDIDLSYTLSAAISQQLGLSDSGAAVMATGAVSLPDAGKETTTLVLTEPTKTAIQSAEGKSIETFQTTLTATATDLAGNNSTDTLSVRLVRNK